MSLERTLLLVIFVILFVVFGAFQFLYYHKQKTLAQQDLLERTEQIRNVLMATRRVYHHQFIDSELPLTPQTIGFLPAHAMNRISADFRSWDATGLSFNNVSDDPRNPEQQADWIETEAMAYFRENPDRPRRFVAFVDERGKRHYHYAQPIWIESYCLQCHGAQSSAPETIRSLYDAAYDFEVGELRGILSIRVPAAYIEERVREGFIVQVGWGLLLLFGLWLGLGWTIRRFVSRPLRVLGAGMAQISAGDLGHRVRQLPGEFRFIAERFNEMGGKLEAQNHALKRSESRFRSVVETATDGIVLTNATGEVLIWNRACEDLFGYSGREMLGHPVDRVIPERYRGPHGAGLAGVAGELQADGTGRVTELMGLHRSGKELPIEIALNQWEDGAERHFLAIIRDIRDRKRAEAEAHRLAYSDPLTQLGNRRLLLERLSSAIVNCDRRGRSGALFLLDLDEFQKINDTLGHGVGDALLVETGQRLRQITRERDTVVRLGGDEFVILVEGLPTSQQQAAEQAKIVAENIHGCLEQPFVFEEGHSLGAVTASIGVTLYCGLPTAPEEVLKQADLAMYQAKNGGRNQTRFFDPAMQAMLEQRAALERALRRALKQGEFELHFQPQVDRRQHQIGVEALLRWNDPEAGRIPPMRFIPVAEESGLIVEIGDWVLNSACAQIRAWADHPVAGKWQVAINVSARQFHQVRFVGQVRNAIAKHGIDPSRLVLEITEHVVLESLDDVMVRMSEISVCVHPPGSSAGITAAFGERL